MADDAPIAVTFKLGNGNEPWVVLRAQTADHLDVLLTEVEERGAAITATWNALKVSGEIQAVGTQQQAVQAVQQGLGGQVMQQPAQPQVGCQHGPMIRKSGIGKNGKPYVGWFCPANDKTCPAKWGENPR